MFTETLVAACAFDIGEKIAGSIVTMATILPPAAAVPKIMCLNVMSNTPCFDVMGLQHFTLGNALLHLLQ